MAVETSRILKARSARNIGTESAFNYEDIREHCDAYIKETKAKAQTILDEAEAEAKRLRDTMFNEAREAGRKAGLADAERQIETRSTELARQTTARELETTLPAMRAAADALLLERDHWLAQWQESAVRLAVAVAEKIIRRQIKTAPNIADDIIQEALQLAAGSPQVTLRLNPLDHQRIGEETQSSIFHAAGSHRMEIVADAGISPGGCLIQTQHGTIDARLETQLERIAAELLE